MTKVLRKFNIEDVKTVGLTLSANCKLSGSQCPKTKVDKTKMNMISYASTVESLMYAMCSINVNINEDEMVQVCLGGLAQRFNPLRMTILARETPPSFFNLQSMLLVQENHLQTRPTRRKDKCSSPIRLVAEDDV